MVRLIDLHNHILRYVVPIHRTSPDLSIAMRMAEIAARDGIRIITSTPHFRPDIADEDIPARLALMEHGVRMLNEALEERGLDLRVVGGAEIAMSDRLPDLAARGLLPTLGSGRHLLIELPLVTYAAYAEQTLFELQLQGYTPLLAHFERTVLSMGKDIDPERLVERGVKLQVNCESLVGKRGRAMAKLARDLVRRGLASGLGSDAHDAEDKTPRISPCRKAVTRAGGRGAFERLSWEEPMRIIGGPA